MRRLTPFAVLSIAVVVSFGQGVAAVTTSHQVTPQTRDALAAWARFPVDAPKRPLVLIDNDVVDDPATGFTGPSNGAEKLAYIEGDIDPPATFPTGPRSAGGYPLITAKAAFNALIRARGHGPRSTLRLQVTTVTLGTGTFQTDRGQRRLPAWLFQLQDVTDPAAVLAVSKSDIFAPRISDTGTTVGAATISSDDRTLTVEFSGARQGRGPCEASYALNVAESRTAVAIAVKAILHDAAVLCAAPAETTTAKVILARPLGNRVVVDAASLNAVPVTARR